MFDRQREVQFGLNYQEFQTKGSRKKSMCCHNFTSHRSVEFKSQEYNDVNSSWQIFNQQSGSMLLEETTSGLSLKFQVTRYMQLVGGE